ncbi:carboxymuconolactone decarboxylase family protein [Ectopseudomonas hydrolytica]|uniref:carboxymuconolactone decarboxylase family protein n=1 Tax=Ectopseudomonas hydrolytica TaxID=2493633 RepID=UPI003EDFCA59
MTNIAHPQHVASNKTARQNESNAVEPHSGWINPSAPRLTPLLRKQLPWFPRTMLKILGGRARISAPNLFLTLMRHRHVFRFWARFAARLMPYGTLDRVDCELAILRVAWNCRSQYEWYQHVAIGLDAGLTAADVARVTEGPDSTGWSEHQATVIRAADEVHETRIISDATWQKLSRRYDDKLLIELCMVIGHYEMLASLLNSLGIQPEEALKKRVLEARIGSHLPKSS